MEADAQPLPCAAYNGSAGGRWLPPSRPGAGYRFKPPCELVRPEQAAVQRCLAGRHLLFFGDSLQRYLYLTLANFLVSGRWPDDALSSSPCYESTYFNQDATEDEKWLRYFAGTNQQLGGHEICDCWRVSCCKEAALHENRYTRVGTAAVSFVTQLMSPTWAPHGSVAPAAWEAMHRVVACSPGRCNESTRVGRAAAPWRTNAVDFMRRVLPRLGVTDVLINSGHHWAAQQHRAHTTRVFEAARRGASSRAWWRTTTPRLKGGGVSRSSRMGFALKEAQTSREAAALGLGVLDTQEMVMALARVSPAATRDAAWVDGTHLQCSVNREILIVLLNRLCGPELRGAPARRQKPEHFRSPASGKRKGASAASTPGGAGAGTRWRGAGVQSSTP